MHSYRLAFRAHFCLSVNQRALWAKLFQTRHERLRMQARSGAAIKELRYNSWDRKES